MPDVTREVWEHQIADGHPFQVRLIPPPAFDGMDYLDHDLLIFWMSDRQDGTREGRARCQMASMAPTLYRMLERVVAEVRLPYELGVTIKINLHRASLDTHPMPVLHVESPRRSAWEHIMDDPILTGERAQQLMLPHMGGLEDSAKLDFERAVP